MPFRRQRHTYDHLGENGVNWTLFYKTIYLKIEDTFFHPLNAGRCGNNFNFLGCKLNMM